MGASTKTPLRLLDLRSAGIIGPGLHIFEVAAQNSNCRGGGPELKNLYRKLHGWRSKHRREELAELASGGILGRVVGLFAIEYGVIKISNMRRRPFLI